MATNSVPCLSLSRDPRQAKSSLPPSSRALCSSSQLCLLCLILSGGNTMMNSGKYPALVSTVYEFCTPPSLVSNCTPHYWHSSVPCQFNRCSQSPGVTRIDPPIPLWAFLPFLPMRTVVWSSSLPGKATVLSVCFCFF